MACTTSIGPGATNMVTAAALAHVNRLPVLLLPGDVFANRRPDPVLQQVEDFGDGTVSANDCFRPVSRYFDRITRPEQIIRPAARDAVLTDPADCGPVTLALPPGRAGRGLRLSRGLLRPSASGRRDASAPTRRAREAAAALARERRAADRRGRRRALRGGGEHARGVRRGHGIPVAETQAGKGASPGTIRSTSARSASPARPPRTRSPREADLVLAVGTRLQDFHHRLVGAVPRSGAHRRRSTCSPSMPASTGRIARRRRPRRPRRAVRALRRRMARRAWTQRAANENARWRDRAARDRRDQRRAALRRPGDRRGAARARRAGDIVVCAAGGLPGELHKLWQAADPAATTSNTATPAWATRSPAGSASRWRAPSARSSSWSATAPT